MNNIDKLVVKYNNKIVGYLKIIDNNQIAFQYDLTWIKEGFSISPFSLPLEDKVFISNKDYFGGLFGVFYDALPGGWGELLIRRKLARENINYDKLNPLTKLALLQDNSLGGLTYEPTFASENEITDVDLDSLYPKINKIFESLNEQQDLDIIYKLGGASGGARPKAHLNIKGEEWIVKFPSSIDPKGIGIAEYNANELAKNCGINVNLFALFPSKLNQGYFGAKRFDRVDGNRLHVISLSSILETTHRIPNLDYTHLFQVIQKISVNQEDMYEAYKRMCFNVLYQNKDDHGKNMAFIYNEAEKGYRLSPFYDITATPNKFEHEMTVLGEGNPTVETLIKIGKYFNLSNKKMNEIINRIKKEIST